jgi:hypothetical protein
VEETSMTAAELLKRLPQPEQVRARLAEIARERKVLKQVQKMQAALPQQAEPKS